MTRQELNQKISKILHDQKVMTLSVADDSGPWGAPVFYAADGYNLYFVSNPSSRHGRAVEISGRVAASTFDPDSRWRSIQGLQMEGMVACLADPADTEQAIKSYVHKFPFTEVFFRQKNGLEPEVAEKVSAVKFYRFRPQRIVLVDNTVRFGFHSEILVEGDCLVSAGQD